MSLLEPPQDVLKLLRMSLPPHQEAENEEIVSYVSFLAAGLAHVREFDASVWSSTLEPYFQLWQQQSDNNGGTHDDNGGNSSSTHWSEVIEEFRQATEKATMGIDDDAESYGGEEDDVEEVCNLRFNLAYGGKILLHQTKLRLLRGRRYALMGKNGTGKTTLMNAINSGKLDGWPVHLKTAYVESGSNVDPEFVAQNVLQHLLDSTGRSEADIFALLQDQLLFTPKMLKGTIGELSGGWQMKLRLARAVLLDPDIYCLDEPTNHLSHDAVDWLSDFLLAMKDRTVLCVSHDTQFLEKICTDVIHYEQRDNWGPHRKLVHYKGKMSDFVKRIPEAKHYFELATTDFKFTFPDPGRLEGVKTSTQKIMEMENVCYAYPGSDHNTLIDVNLKMSLSSRVVVLGANGAGKTTLIKMIVGDSQPSNLGVCKFYVHPNLRIAYVAQHAFHHVEEHMDDSPVAYIQWRFREGWDREKLESEAFRLTPDELKAIDENQIEGIWSRRLRAGVLEYEIKKRNIREKDNKYFSREELFSLGLEHLVKQTDEKIAAKEAGLDLRPVTTTEIQKHLDLFGLPQEFGTYGRIRGLSGGQKVKLVLAAAFWTVPHLVVMDEPTNFLDREALGALSAALNEWGGAVLMISHNREFYTSVCKEEWRVEDGTVYVQGISSEREMKAVARKKKYEKELEGTELLDKAGGNTNANGDKYKDATTNFWGQTVSKKEVRQYDKAKKKGDVASMRKILQIPNGKIMPGFEELGDGKDIPN